MPASAWYRSYCSVGAVVAVPRPSFTQKWMKVLRSSWIWRVLFIRHCASSLLLIAKMSDLLIECESIEFCEPESVSSDCAEVDCLSMGEAPSFMSTEAPLPFRKLELSAENIPRLQIFDGSPKPFIHPAFDGRS